jgi:P27 family predicted phage terminase small subunit
MTPPPLPSHLGTRSRAWAESVLTEAGDAATETDLRLIVLAAEALDRAGAARRLIQREGITYTDRFGAPRQHPAVAVERDARAAYSRLVAQLGLDDTTEEPTPYRGANGRVYRPRKGS